MLLVDFYLCYKPKFQGKRHFIPKISYTLICFKKNPAIKYMKKELLNPKLNPKTPRVWVCAKLGY